MLSLLSVSACPTSLCYNLRNRSNKVLTSFPQILLKMRHSYAYVDVRRTARTCTMQPGINGAQHMQRLSRSPRRSQLQHSGTGTPEAFSKVRLPRCLSLHELHNHLTMLYFHIPQDMSKPCPLQPCLSTDQPLCNSDHRADSKIGSRGKHCHNHLCAPHAWAR